MTKSSILFILGAFLLLTSSNCSKTPDPDNKGEEDPPVDVPTEPTFQRYVKDQVLSSRTIREHVKYSVYLPADYEKDTETRYSVVYMLHGLGDNNNSWNGSYLHANSKIDFLEMQGMTKMIYVFPQGFSSYYCNFYDGTYNYMDMFVQELIPLIDNTYRTIPDKKHRAITGYSMGGFGACALAEKHPEMFEACAPLSMSVRTDWQYMEESQSGWENQWGIIFGGVGETGEGRITEYYKQHCPIHYFNAENKEQLSTVHWYLICGDDEKNLLYSNDQLHCVMRDNGYDHEYRVVDGGHSSSVWNPALEEVLPWFDYYMNGGNLWSPDLLVDYQTAPVERNEDGVYVSGKYAENKTGTAMYIVHLDELDDYKIELIMGCSIIDPLFDTGYVLLPCDLSKKSLTEWMEYWDSKYPNNKKLVMGYGKGAEAALALPADTFRRSYYINPAVGANPNVEYDQDIYFCGTDDDTNYQGMNTLYNVCKNKGARFEYRIVNAYNDPYWNIISSLSTIKSKIYY